MTVLQLHILAAIRPGHAACTTEIAVAAAIPTPIARAMLDDLARQGLVTVEHLDFRSEWRITDTRSIAA